ncbi:MAG TPA: AMP-binding protein [Bryobacteraceae bacterium]|nr:AMP-binding protein [Bryobacteraceae bacterium]
MNSIYSSKPWLSQYRSPAELPVPSWSMIDAFERSAREAPEAPAIFHFEKTISFGALDDLAGRFACRLAEWGVGKGDRVAVSLQNDPEFEIVELGTWKRGAILVPLNPMFKEREIAYHLSDSGAKIWVTPDGAREPVARASGVDRVIDSGALMDLLQGVSPDPAPRVDVHPEDIAFLVYTSGTTGPAKGARILHRNVAFNAEVYRAWMKIGPDDVILGLAPLFHITGLVAQLALSQAAGIPLMLMHRFDGAETLRLSRKWRPTLCVAAITAYIALMNESGDCPGFLPKCYSGGAPVAPSLTERFQARFGTYIHNIYGLTESASPSHATPLGARAPVDAASGALSIGVPVPNCEAKVISLEDPDREMPPGEAGELALKGPMIFPGYWNKPAESERAFHNGYFRTGDVAIMDENGWFYLVDRKKDMIIASGFKVWPREVEDTLYQHPAVREAAVVGAPDEYRGETVKAFVALEEAYAGKVTEAEIIQFCRDRMAAYKYPRSVVFVPEIPKTATGKFLRRQLREMQTDAG